MFCLVLDYFNEVNNGRGNHIPPLTASTIEKDANATSVRYPVHPHFMATGLQHSSNHSILAETKFINML